MNKQTALKQESSSKEDINRKLQRQQKDLKEDNISRKIKEMDMSEKKNILEKKLDISEAEILTLQSQLQLSNERIEHLTLTLTAALSLSLIEQKMISRYFYKTTGKRWQSRKKRKIE